MRDDPRRNLKRVEQALLYEEVFHDFDQPEEDPIEEEEEDLLEMVDQLIEDLESEDQNEDYEEEEEPPIRNYANNYGRHNIPPETKNHQPAKKQSPPKLDKNAAVLVKTRRQLRKEARIQKKQERKSGINRNLKGLTLLAALEILGILAIIGWWLT